MVRTVGVHGICLTVFGHTFRVEYEAWPLYALRNKRFKVGWY